MPPVMLWAEAKDVVKSMAEIAIKYLDKRGDSRSLVHPSGAVELLFFAVAEVIQLSAFVVFQPRLRKLLLNFPGGSLAIRVTRVLLRVHQGADTLLLFSFVGVEKTEHPPQHV